MKDLLKILTFAKNSGFKRRFEIGMGIFVWLNLIYAVIGIISIINEVL